MEIKNNTVRRPIGIAGSLSGARVMHSEFFRNASSLLERHGVPVILGDDAASAQTAKRLAEKFVSRDVCAVIGHFNSDCARAVIPIYRAHGVKLLLPASTHVGLDVGDGVFRMCANDSMQGSAIAEKIRATITGSEKVELRVDDSEYSQRLQQSIRAEISDLIESVLDISDPKQATASVCIVLAVAHRAIEFVESQRLQPSKTVFVFSDEAAVAEFDRAVKSVAGNCLIVTPEPSYAASLALGCDMVVEWYKQQCESFGQWLINQKYFSESGEAIGASWVLRTSSAA